MVIVMRKEKEKKGVKDEWILLGWPWNSAEVQVAEM